MAEDTPDTIIVEHRKSTTFISAHADGCYIGGPTAHGNFHLLFYADSSEILAENGTKQNNGVYMLEPQAKVTPFREDRATISMSEVGLRSLAIAIQNHFSASISEKQTKN